MIERISSMLDETELKRKWLIEEKPHTCEEVGGTPQNFLLAFIDELWETRKIRILKKWKKIAGKIEEKKKNNCSFYTCVPKTTTIWGTIPEIESETTFLSFWAIFCPLTPPFTSPPPNNPENINFEKMKKHLEMSSC